MGSRLRRRTWIIIGALAVVLGIGLGVGIRLFVWPVGGPGAPERFDEADDWAAFVDVTSAAGFNHVHHKPYLDPRLDPIMSWVASVGAAAAAADYDNDGWIDLYATDSHKGNANHLYRNNGDGTFLDLGAQAGVADVNDESGTSMDCVWGDYDNDGHVDLFVVKWGRDQLFHNDGDGTFTDVTATAFRNEGGGPGSPWTNGCAAIWVDYDNDGFLDLYVGNYFAPHDLWHLEHTRVMHDSFEKARNAGENALFHSNGDGTFTEVGAALGLDDPGWTLSVGHGDVNNDGWPDIYSADDFGPDQLFLNNGDGTFRNISGEAIGSDTMKGMNVDFGDIDRNGWLDIYITNITTADYLQEGNMLWHNDAATDDGVPVFMDIAVDAGVHDGGWGWGAKLFDFDNDADLDIVSVNGFITAGEGSYWYDLASWTVTGQDVTDALNWPPIGNRSFSGNESTRLWRNDGQQRFAEIAGRYGVTDSSDGRGVVVFDYDNDGDLDLYLANQGMAPRFYRNDVGGGGHWLGLRLTGNAKAGSNRDAIGTRVTVVTADGRQVRELDGGNSYCGQSDRRVYFGLGDALMISTLEIRWPSRRVQVVQNVRSDQLLSIEEPADLPEAASSLIPTTRDRSAVVRARPGAPERVTLSPAERDTILSDLENQLRRRPEDLALACKYREQCIKLGEHQRSVGFFEELADSFPMVRNVRLQLSAAYVDQIPTCGGMATIVCKGTLARQSLDQIDILMDADDTWWPAVYSRAMNHLHWPRALRHSKASAADFRRCIALQTANGPANARSYYVRAYVGLGDALAKDGDHSAAQQAWHEGLRAFPQDPVLRTRVALGAAEARAYVEKVRNLEQQIDTDFSFLISP